MLKYPYTEKVGKKKRIKLRVLHPKKSLFECISPIMATNRPRKKNCHPVKSAICLWQMCITGVVIFFIVRSYINAETEKYQFNCRKYTISCDHQRLLITQSLRNVSMKCTTIVDTTRSFYYGVRLLRCLCDFGYSTI